ncbi:hypothetical protein Amsp01_104740 [Amycolatopsis sp. NBRC 101858]|nr:hypothetical protein Amsp01_104740 [Amycolatopsis sp. NBRC 101858]
MGSVHGPQAIVPAAGAGAADADGAATSADATAAATTATVTLEEMARLTVFSLFGFDSSG